MCVFLGLSESVFLLMESQDRREEDKKEDSSKKMGLESKSLLQRKGRLLADRLTKSISDERDRSVTTAEHTPLAQKSIPDQPPIPDICVMPVSVPVMTVSWTGGSSPSITA